MRQERQHPVLARFVNNPPELEGSVALNVLAGNESGAQVELRHDGQLFAGRAEALSVPYPSGLRRLVAAHPEASLVLVERASAGLLRAAEEEGVSCLDLRGRGRVVGPGFVYFVAPAGARARGEDLPADSSAAALKRRVSPFAPKASRAVRAILHDPRHRWRVSDVAELAPMNAGNAHRILGALVDGGFVERDEDRYVVVDPGSLLEAWCEQGRGPRESVSLAVRDGIAEDVARLVDRLGGSVAISGELAAERYAPHLVAEGAIVHVLDPARWDAERMADAAPSLAPGGRGRLEVALSDAGVGRFGREVGGLPLVGPAQLYFDLYRDRGRGREAAERVRQAELGY